MIILLFLSNFIYSQDKEEECKYIVRGNSEGYDTTKISSIYCPYDYLCKYYNDSYNISSVNFSFYTNNLDLYMDSVIHKEFDNTTLGGKFSLEIFLLEKDGNETNEEKCFVHEVNHLFFSGEEDSISELFTKTNESFYIFNDSSRINTTEMLHLRSIQYYKYNCIWKDEYI